MGLRAPSGLAARGKALWKAVTDDYVLSAAELVLLEECCRQLDVVARLAVALDAEPVMVGGSKGQRQAHPGYRTLAEARGLLARLLGQLAVPAAATAEVVALTKSTAARKAARARWGTPGQRRTG